MKVIFLVASTCSGKSLYADEFKKYLTKDKPNSAITISTDSYYDQW